MAINDTHYGHNDTHYEDRINDSLTSLIGAGVGGGIFLMVVILGVIFWMSREREEDEEIRLKAEKFQRVKMRGLLLNPKESPAD